MAADFLHHAFQGVAMAIQVDVTELPDQAKPADLDHLRCQLVCLRKAHHLVVLVIAGIEGFLRWQLPLFASTE
jgi:hypothetical protein